MAKDLIVRIEFNLFKKNKRKDTFNQSTLDKIMIFHSSNITKYVYNFIITKL